MSLTTLKITLSKTLKVWSERSWVGRISGLLDRPGAVRAGLAIVLIVAAAVTPGFASFVLLCAGVACGAHAITRALPYGDGLREHRQ